MTEILDKSELESELDPGLNFEPIQTHVKSKRGRKPKINKDKDKELELKEKKPRKPRETKELKEKEKEENNDGSFEETKNEKCEKYEKNEKNEEQDEDIENDPEPEQEHKQKKRGRKPKGGKIIQQTNLNDNSNEQKLNIILHLKCNMSEITNYNTIENNETEINAYNNDTYSDMCGPVNQTYITDKFIQVDNENEEFEDKEKDSTKEIWRKLKQLEHNLHTNSIMKKSACFWDTCDFDNPPIYIPKCFINDKYEVYGCFCSPECAAAYLFKRENIDKSTKFERYHMMNHIYSKIYGYNKNIKLASDPNYMLEKFLGNLTIQEYRSLLRTERLFLVIDKPLTKIFPELHEDNDDFILNNKIIPTNTYQVKGKMMRKRTNKTSMLGENFGINS